MDPLTRDRHSSLALEMLCPSLFQGIRSRGHTSKQLKTAQHSPVSVFTTLAFNISEICTVL